MDHDENGKSNGCFISFLTGFLDIFGDDSMIHLSLVQIDWKYRTSTAWAKPFKKHVPKNLQCFCYSFVPVPHHFSCICV